MNPVKKFTTFEELKACEGKTENHISTLKKHNDFKKAIMEIRSAKILQDNKTKPKL